MSLRLILTRHAKSDWDDPALDDHDRPLNARGTAASAGIGRWLTARGYRPNLALLSTARRVADTWTGIASRLDAEPTVIWEADLYHSSPDTMLAALASQSAQSVILIAHNPGMAALAHTLAAAPPQRPEFERFPTCATLVLDFDVTAWDQIGAGRGRVLDFVVPRDLTD